MFQYAEQHTALQTGYADRPDYLQNQLSNWPSTSLRPNVAVPLQIGHQTTWTSYLCLVCGIGEDAHSWHADACPTFVLWLPSYISHDDTFHNVPALYSMDGTGSSQNLLLPVVDAGQGLRFY